MIDKLSAPKPRVTATPTASSPRVSSSTSAPSSPSAAMRPAEAATFSGGGTATVVPEKPPSPTGALQTRLRALAPVSSTKTAGVFGKGYQDAGRFGSAVVPPALLSSSASSSSSLRLSKAAFSLDAQTGRPHVQLHVTSQKDLKVLPALDFVVATLQRLWPEFSADDVTVFRHKTKSGVAEQPWGLEGGSQGAVGRTQDAGLRAQVNAQAQAGDNVVIVSLENTVAPVPLSTASMPAAWQAEHGDAYVDAAGLVAVDVAALHVELFAGGARQVVQGLSPGVIVPRALVDEVRHSGAPAERAGFDVTVGQVIASAHGLRNDDWHAAFVGQSRSQLLSQGLLALPVTTTA